MQETSGDKEWNTQKKGYKRLLTPEINRRGHYKATESREEQEGS